MTDAVPEGDAGQVPIALFTLDPGLLFPETYALWRRLEATYGISIRAVTPAQSVGEQAAVHGDALWEREPDHCCELRKVQPLARALGDVAGWVTAIRREQTPERATARGAGKRECGLHVAAPEKGS